MLLIGLIDLIGLGILIGALIMILQLTNSAGLSSSFQTLMMIFPILEIVLVSGLRMMTFFVFLFNRKNIKFVKAYYLVRSITTILFFLLCLIYLILIISLYKGSTLFNESTDDIDFILSDQIKWMIILLAICLVAGTLFDLYYSLAIRTYYM